MDLLEHERRVAALLGRVLVPGHLLDIAVDGPAGDVGDLGAVGRDRHDLGVLEPEHVAGLAQERGNRGGDEGLVFAEADDQRAFLAGRDQLVGLVGVHGDERVVLAELRECGADGAGEDTVGPSGLNSGRIRLRPVGLRL